MEETADETDEGTTEETTEAATDEATDVDVDETEEDSTDSSPESEAPATSNKAILEDPFIVFDKADALKTVASFAIAICLIFM